jgi:tryptophan-rich sensory protein
MEGGMYQGAPRLVGAVLLCEAAGGVGAIAVSLSINTWYRTLKKPSFNPPDWVFGPVWTTLYLLMGVAYHLASGKVAERSVARRARGLFAIQLALNAAWSFLFFGRRSPLTALIEIVALWLAVAATMLAFLRLSRVAALLLLPYLAWTTFAAALNYAIWRLNR